jgi:hypothetical protein
LLERPKPVIKPQIAYKPVINKPQTRTTTSSSTSSSIRVPAKKSNIISQFVFKKNIKNSFYA